VYFPNSLWLSRFFFTGKKRQTLSPHGASWNIWTNFNEICSFRLMAYIRVVELSAILSINLKKINGNLREPQHRSSQVWHALSRDPTFCTLTPTCLTGNGMNYTCLCIPSQKPVIIYWSWRDGRLSWPRQHVVSQQSAQYRCMTEITVVSCSNSHASLGKWILTASPQLLPERTNSGAKSRLSTIYLVVLTHYAARPPCLLCIYIRYANV